MRLNFGAKVFATVNTSFLIVLSLTMVLPLVNVLAISLSDPSAVVAREVLFIPVELSFASWNNVLSQTDLWRSLWVNIMTTVVGTVLSLLVSSLMAYPLSRRDFQIRNHVMFLVVFSMIFHAPMIPYFLAVKSLGLIDSIWVLIIPHMVISFNLIILRTFFMQLPHEISESARIDGCTDYGILFRMVLPLSKAAMATMGLFYGVVYWNNFFLPLLFIRDTKLYPLQMKLREVVVDSDLILSVQAGFNSQTLQAATIIFVTVPILLMYPFIQKYFVQGATLGSVKE